MQYYCSILATLMFSTSCHHNYDFNFTFSIIKKIRPVRKRMFYCQQMQNIYRSGATGYGPRSAYYRLHTPANLQILFCYTFQGDISCFFPSLLFFLLCHRKRITEKEKKKAISMVRSC